MGRDVKRCRRSCDTTPENQRKPTCLAAFQKAPPQCLFLLYCGNIHRKNIQKRLQPPSNTGAIEATFRIMFCTITSSAASASYATADQKIAISSFRVLLLDRVELHDSTYYLPSLTYNRYSFEVIVLTISAAQPSQAFSSKSSASNRLPTDDAIYSHLFDAQTPEISSS